MLPDAHNDFIFAVIAEEYGVLVCLVLARAVRPGGGAGVLPPDRAKPTTSCASAATGLALLFGLQAIINMAVNSRPLPTKGMTLPFISIGGSSMLAVGLAPGHAAGASTRPPAPIRSA